MGLVVDIADIKVNEKNQEADRRAKAVDKILSEICLKMTSVGSAVSQALEISVALGVSEVEASLPSNQVSQVEVRAQLLSRPRLSSRMDSVLPELRRPLSMLMVARTLLSLMRLIKAMVERRDTLTS